MSAPEDHGYDEQRRYHVQLVDEVRRQRERLSEWQESDPDPWARYCRVELAELLIELIEVTAQPPPQSTTIEDSPADLRTWLDEASMLVDKLSADAEPSSPEYRRLCSVAADYAVLRYELFAVIGADREAAELLERAIADEPLPTNDSGDGPSWWDNDLSADVRTRLAGHYWNVYDGDGDDAERALDRVIELLSPLHSDAGHAGATYADVDRRLRTTMILGQALADRSRGEERFLGPGRSADRTKAIELLLAAVDSPVLDDQLVLGARLSVGQLLYAEHFGDDEQQPEPEAARALFDRIFALFEPVIREGDPEHAGLALHTCVTLAQDRAEQLGTWSSQESVVWWSRRAISSPAVVGHDAREIRLSHAIHLIDRAEGGWPELEPGYPPPDRQQDIAEAIGLCEEVLDTLLTCDQSESDPGELAAERLWALVGIFAALERPAADDLDDESLDRLINRGSELLEVTPLDESYRGDVHRTLGRVLAARAARFGLPGFVDSTRRMLLSGSPDRTAVRFSPDTISDLDRAVELLRTGTNLCSVREPEYYVSAALLAAALVQRSIVTLPDIDRALLREGLRWFRIVEESTVDLDLDIAPDIKNLMIISLAYYQWSSEPFLREGAFTSPPYLPDLEGLASIEDDLQLLDRLIEDRLDGENVDPAFLMIHHVTAYLRDPQLTDFDVLGSLDRIRRSWRRAEPGELPFEPFMALLAAQMHLRAVERDLATGPLDAEFTTELTKAVQTFEPGSLLGQMFSQILEFLDHAGILTPAHGRIVTTLATEAGSSRPAAEPAHDPGSRVDEEPIDLGAAILVGGGSGYPFSEPIGRVIEIVEAAAASGESALRDGPVVPALLALARHDRWLRERDAGDLAAAITLAQRAVSCAAASPRLSARLDAFLAGLVLDRHMLLGAPADLAAAGAAFDALVPRAQADPQCPDLSTLLIADGKRVGFADVGKLFVDTLAGGEAASETVPDEESSDSAPTHAPVRPSFYGEVLAAYGMTLLLAVPERDSATKPTPSLHHAAELLAQAEAELPADHPRMPAVKVESGRIKAAQAARAGDVAALRTIVHQVVAAAVGCRDESPHRTALLLRAAALLAERPRIAGFAGPPETAGLSIDRAIALLDKASEASGHSYLGSRPRCRYGLGRLLLNRYARAGHRADLERAISVLEEARTGFDPTPGDPFAAILPRTLAQAYRARGTDAHIWSRRARDAAKSVLSAHGRAVLLQSGARDGLAVARQVSGDMMRLVRWCVEDAQPSAAVEALELGRGLVLHTSTVSAAVPELLREANRPDLAEEWERGAAGTPSDAGSLAVGDGLRRRVLQALEGGGAERRLLSAPTPAVIARALRAIGADALVHLVPGGDGRPGYALTVTDAADVYSTELPDLNVRPGGAVDRYLLARSTAEKYASISRPPLDATGQQRSEYERRIKKKARVEAFWRKQLAVLCDWAGAAAMGRIVSETTFRVGGRPPRIVLAPAGALGAVPWHAARLGAPPGRRVCQDAVISFCSTARQFVDAAARTRLPLEGRQVLVVDPGGSATMQQEARALRAQFYPQSGVVGAINWHEAFDGPWTGPEPLPPTVEALAPYLPGRGATSAALLIANSHAVSAPQPMRSWLDLDARGDVRLTVEQLLAGTRARNPHASGGLVLLANCASDLTAAEHDEALTLATVFLAAGAASVVGSRWNVVDDHRTLAFMYMFHHFLNGRDEPSSPEAVGSPVDALRAAQLWMLDPARTMPAGLHDGAGLDSPAASARGDPFADLEVWAAFTHHGR